MSQLVVRGDRVLVGGSFRPAAVVVAAGRVQRIGPVDLAVHAERDLRLSAEEVLLPGLVDSHVHVNEPGRADWEGFATATAAAAAGGITTLVDMPLNSIPPTVDVEALVVKQESAQGSLAVDVAFWGGAVPSNAGRLAALHDAGVAGFKCFLLDSGVPEFPPLDEAGLRAAMQEVAALDAVLVVHAEDAATVADAPPPSGRRYADFLASRPDAAEVTAVDTVLRLAERTGARVHILHVSSAAVVPALAAARAAGLPVTAETCPHYLTLAAEEVADGATTNKCCPPVRGRGNRDLLWQALTDGLIDCVVSDHSPCPPSLKRLDTGDFGEAWGGIASLQLSLPLVWSEARRRGVLLPEVSRWMAQAPAALAGLPGKGSIRVGADADLVAFAPEHRWQVDPAQLLHRHPIGPYAGRELHGEVRHTWLRGVPIADGSRDGRLLVRKDD